MSDFDFAPQIQERSHLKALIEADAGIQAQEQKLTDAFIAWWQANEQALINLPDSKASMKLRTDFLQSFVVALTPVGLLDRHKVAGVIASWWEDVRYELKTLASSGFDGLIDSWVDTIRDALEETDEPGSGPQFDPLNHKLVVKLLPEYRSEIAQAEAAIAELEQQKEAFERGEETESAAEEEEAEEGEAAPNYAAALETKLKELKNAIKAAQKRLKSLSQGKLSIAALQKQGKDTTRLEMELAALQTLVTPVEADIAAIEQQLQPYREIKDKLAVARATLRALKAAFVERLQAARDALTSEQAQRLVLDLFREGMSVELERYVTAHRQQVIAAVENWWDKYQVPLSQIEAERDAAAQQLNALLQKLGYAPVRRDCERKS